MLWCLGEHEIAMVLTEVHHGYVAATFAVGLSLINLVVQITIGPPC